jgi:hypothetical protein
MANTTDIDEATQAAGEAIRAQLAARMIAEELGPLPQAARELAKELSGPKGWGHHVGGEGAASMHRYSPDSLLSLALHSREVRAQERIASALERIADGFAKLPTLGKNSDATPAVPPPASVDTSSVKAPAGADAPAGASTSTTTTTKTG